MQSDVKNTFHSNYSMNYYHKVIRSCCHLPNITHLRYRIKNSMFAFPFPTERNDKKFAKAIVHQINSIQAIVYSCIRFCGFVPYLTSS